MKSGFTNHRCPKCGGNTYIDSDCYRDGGLVDWYDHETCLQCGYIAYNLEDPVEATKVIGVMKRAISLKKEPLPV